MCGRIFWFSSRFGGEALRVLARTDVCGWRITRRHKIFRFGNCGERCTDHVLASDDSSWPLRGLGLDSGGRSAIHATTVRYRQTRRDTTPRGQTCRILSLFPHPKPAKRNQLAQSREHGPYSRPTGWRRETRRRLRISRTLNTTPCLELPPVHTKSAPSEYLSNPGSTKTMQALPRPCVSSPFTGLMSGPPG